MPSQKRSRLRRKQRQRARARGEAPLSGGLKERLDALRLSRDQRLGKIGIQYRKKLEEINVEWAAKRRELWHEFEDTRDSILGAENLRRQEEAERLLREVQAAEAAAG